MKILIGNTGLVGQTLMDGIHFDLTFNSKNINEFESLVTDGSELFLSCLPATKWKVNQDVKGDIENINRIYEIIKTHKYEKIVLISTIDAYVDSPEYSDEDFPPIVRTLNYGSNRYIFELMVNELECDNIQIYRLPALFSKRIKKNILFDLLNDNNIDKINYNSAFQWYDLKNLVSDISKINQKGTYNLFTEPIETSAILSLFGLDGSHVDTKMKRASYNFKTKYSQTGYIQSKDEVLEDIKNFVNDFRNKSISIQ